jgi:hypothetical protein
MALSNLLKVALFIAFPFSVLVEPPVKLFGHLFKSRWGVLNYEGETLWRSKSENVPEEAEAAEESSRVLTHARASFFHDLDIRSQRHRSVLALPCDARFGHNCRN